MLDHTDSDLLLCLTAADFPAHYRNMAHTDDYSEVEHGYSLGPEGYRACVHRNRFAGNN